MPLISSLHTLQATVCGRAVLVLPTSLLMEAQVEFVVKAGLCKDELKSSRLAQEKESMTVFLV